MKPRQSIPKRWLIIDGGLDRHLWLVVRRLPRGSGVLIVEFPGAPALRRLRHLARLSELLIVADAERQAARVHNLHELRKALLRRTPIVLLSPMFKTRSHPDWEPLSRMHAASLARLGHRRLVALGGMSDERYRKVAQLGFIGWAGISSWARRGWS